MSSQTIRNNITTSIRRVITDVKRKAISEGKKKVMELKEQLLSPETIIKILSADIDQNSCSEEGRKKLNIPDTMIRLSIGLEDVDDLIEDIENALKITV